MNPTGKKHRYRHRLLYPFRFGTKIPGFGIVFQAKAHQSTGYINHIQACCYKNLRRFSDFRQGRPTFDMVICAKSENHRIRCANRLTHHSNNFALKTCATFKSGTAVSISAMVGKWRIKLIQKKPMSTMNFHTIVPHLLRPQCSIHKSLLNVRYFLNRKSIDCNRCLPDNFLSSILPGVTNLCYHLCRSFSMNRINKPTKTLQISIWP